MRKDTEMKFQRHFKYSEEQMKKLTKDQLVGYAKHLLERLEDHADEIAYLKEQIRSLQEYLTWHFIDDGDFPTEQGDYRITGIVGTKHHNTREVMDALYTADHRWIVPPRWKVYAWKKIEKPATMKGRNGKPNSIKTCGDAYDD